jgi:hypothetical protein
MEFISDSGFEVTLPYTWVKVVKVEGGYMVFDTWTEYYAWTAQV